MNCFRLTATLESPVAIKRDRQSERSEGVRSIGGTLLRGALATVYLQQHGVADDSFGRLFLDENRCRYGPLDPADRVFPQTAAACKREGIGHGLVDLLWFRLAQQWVAGVLPEEAEQAWRQCRMCKADIKNRTGFWYDANGQVREAERDRRTVAAHVGIDRVTSTAAESVFYTLEAMAPGDRDADLFGWLAADDETRTTLEELLASEDHVVYVGHHRTRGYGGVRLSIGESVEPPDEPQLFQAWDRWSESLIAFLTASPFRIDGLDAEGDFFFSLSLPNGAILLDDVLRYTLDPTAMEKWLPPLPDPTDVRPVKDRPFQTLASGGALQCVTAVAKHERVRGWNTAHGLPRHDEWGLMRGTVYTYWFRGTRQERQQLKTGLRQLSDAGIGIRRNEGFGVVQVSDDFHSRFCRQEEQR
ncbi:MAG: hypothetical protein GXY83_27765 [Rhodopirellula sp.]|nr:hypothetical protein [Rhodopirellula sp.]